MRRDDSNWSGKGREGREYMKWFTLTECLGRRFINPRMLVALVDTEAVGTSGQDHNTCWTLNTGTVRLVTGDTSLTVLASAWMLHLAEAAIQVSRHFGLFVAIEETDVQNNLI